MHFGASGHDAKYDPHAMAIRAAQAHEPCEGFRSYKIEVRSGPIATLRPGLPVHVISNGGVRRERRSPHAKHIQVKTFLWSFRGVEKEIVVCGPVLAKRGPRRPWNRSRLRLRIKFQARRATLRPCRDGVKLGQFCKSLGGALYIVITLPSLSDAF